MHEISTVCFTGHRQIGGAYYDHNQPNRTWQAIERLTSAIIADLVSNYNTRKFIVGGALGIDTMAAKCVVAFKQFNSVSPDIKMVLAIPFPSYSAKMRSEEKKIFDMYLAAADEVVMVSQGPFTVRKLFVRNEWMVDNSQMACAFWDGREAGGTYQCMRYAKNKGKLLFLVQTNNNLRVGWW